MKENLKGDLHGNLLSKTIHFHRTLWPSTRSCHRNLSQETSFLEGAGTDQIRGRYIWHGEYYGRRMTELSLLVRKGYGCLFMRRFWATVSHSVTVHRLKWLQHITDQGDELGHHRGSETSREVLATKACWVGGEHKEAENCGSGRLKRLDRSGWGGPGAVSLWDFQSYCIENYCVRGNLPTTEWSWTQPDCPDPSDSWTCTRMPVFCRALPIAEMNPGVFSHTEYWRSHQPITAYLCQNPQARFLSVPDEAVILKNFLNLNLPNYLLVPTRACLQVCKLASVSKQKIQNRLSTYS